jgi:integrase
MTCNNPFSDPSIPSMKWLRDAIASRYDITHQRRMDMVSACNIIEKWTDQPLSMIPASASYLRQFFKNFHHIHAGISKRRVGNVKSLILAALRKAGLSTKLAPYHCALTDEWQSFYDLIDNAYQQSALSRIMRYCSAGGITPDDMNDQVAAKYLEALEAESLIKDPRTNHQTVCRVWNQCSETIDAWPDIKLTVPCYEERLYAISDDLINPALLTRIDEYAYFLQGGNLFDGLSKPFRPSSIKSMRGNVRRYLSALHHAGFDVASISTLKDMAGFETFKIAMHWLWERNDNKTSRSIGEIAWVIRCIAVKHLKCNDEVAEQYSDALVKLRVQNTGLSTKNRSAMQQFDDKSVAKRFLSYPDALWSLSDKESGKKAQLLVQIAIATEILMFAPMRINNLSSLRIDRHFAWIDGRLHISLARDEVKNDTPLDYILPQGTSDRVRSYIDKWRSLFLPEANPFLFPGRNNKPKDVSCLSKQITSYLFKHTGITLTPHQFRHVAAKLLLDARPGHYEVVRKVLGHKNLSTTYEHYAGAETQAAVELYDDVILDIKQGGDGSASGKRNNTQHNNQKIVQKENDLPYLDPFNPFLKGARR